MLKKLRAMQRKLEVLLKRSKKAIAAHRRTDAAEKFPLKGEFPALTAQEIHQILDRIKVQKMPAAAVLRQFYPEYRGEGKHAIHAMQKTLIELYCQRHRDVRPCALAFDLKALLQPKEFFGKKSDRQLFEDLNKLYRITDSYRENRPKELTHAQNRAVSTYRELEEEHERRLALQVWRTWRAPGGRNKVDAGWVEAAHLIARARELDEFRQDLCQQALDSLASLEPPPKPTKRLRVKAMAGVNWLVDKGYTIQTSALAVGSLLNEVASGELTASKESDVLGAIDSLLAPTRTRNGYRRVSCPIDPFEFAALWKNRSVTEESLREAFHSLTEDWKKIRGLL